MTETILQIWQKLLSPRGIFDFLWFLYIFVYDFFMIWMIFSNLSFENSRNPCFFSNFLYLRPIEKYQKIIGFSNFSQK